VEEPTVVVTLPAGQSVVLNCPPPYTALDVKVLSPNSIRVTARAVSILPPPPVGPGPGPTA
jgi:hypothetical protein